MSLFSKLGKNNDKTLYPWSQKKLSGSSHCLPRSAHAATAVAPDAVVVFGGVHKASSKKELFYIDTNNHSANSINASGDIPPPRVAPIMVTLNGHVVLYGGRPMVPEEKYDGHLYVLNLHSKQWSRIQTEGNSPTERSGHSAVAHDGIMYMFGGQKEGNYLNDLFIFNASTFNATPRWEQIGYNNECPEARSGHISAVYENKLYIFGGTDGHHLFNDMWVFDLHTRLWARIEAEGLMPAARESCASSMIDDVVYIIGGKGEHGVELNDLCAYKIKSRRWFRFQNMGPCPSPRHGLTMTAIRERLFVVGGENDTAKVEDSSSIHILDSSKIKYPTDTPSQQQSMDSTHLQSFDSSTEEPLTTGPQKPFMDPRQPQPQQPRAPMSPTYQPQQRPLMNAVQNEAEGQRQPFQAPSSNQPPVRPPRHISTVPEAALRRPRATSPLPQNELDMTGLHRPYPTASPTSPVSIENELMRASPMQPSMLAATEDVQHPMRSSPHGTAPPPRPPREGVGLRSVVADMSQIPSRNQSVPTTPAPEEEQSVPERSLSRSPVNKPALALEEKQALMREIQARDQAISEMKKKENWWRTEVSLARKQQANKRDSFDDGPDADEALLMDVDHLPEDKVKLFEQLVSVKSELRRVKASILQQAQPMSDKVSQADRMRTAALQEAAYFKSKYLALKSRRQQDLAQIEGSRCDELEKRLANALIENEANAKLLQQLQKRSQYDQHARTATEERAREAQERAEEAQQAHQRALEELQVVYARATKAEVQVRDNALKIADLTQQLSEALLAQPSGMSQEVTEAQLKASQLEAANLRARNETASLKQKLAEQMDDIDRLRASLNEREDALAEAKRHVEDYEIQLNMMRDAMSQQQQQNTVNGGFSSTRAY